MVGNVVLHVLRCISFFSAYSTPCHCTLQPPLEEASHIHLHHLLLRQPHSSWNSTSARSNMSASSRFSIMEMTHRTRSSHHHHCSRRQSRDCRTSCTMSTISQHAKRQHGHHRLVVTNSQQQLGHVVATDEAARAKWHHTRPSVLKLGQLTRQLHQVVEEGPDGLTHLVHDELLCVAVKLGHTGGGADGTECGRVAGFAGRKRQQRQRRGCPCVLDGWHITVAGNMRTGLAAA
ncbi:hypothetical protein PTSG_02603 [Salpingoeca rosetta]|uniref:Uncharacterized protein n=1 Tax=Salpingoeca rosetta (strain ATCC 50818 / BSB-021) TaxID=946362 RepID=F2U2S3_SALR5|nr:uncharacterized protein PTSG_02603 [Salpingoeca rosetta]EGD81917.1 hypothetical protein PTSG_02603 [Salpingoeca rosetta]|eukprot:XP_004996100.1 hypothetical protein PTSG_02603 [Salpingoeca rosetta]